MTFSTKNANRDAQLAQVLQALPGVAVYACDDEDRICYWNDAAEQLYGYSRAEALTQPRSHLLQPVLTNEPPTTTTTTASSFVTLRHKLGQPVLVCSSTLAPSADGAVSEQFYVDHPIHGMAAPASALPHAHDTPEALQEQLYRLAFYDPLTQLPNRRLLLERLEHVLAGVSRNQRIGALMFLDLDNFKSLNDTQGHAVGDILLREVAHRLECAVRQSDTVARLGGDEFVVMLEDLDTGGMAAPQAESVAVKILRALEQPYRLEHHTPEGKARMVEHHCSASIGITLFGRPNDRVEDLLKRADMAMYQAKDAGRNTIRFFDNDMQAAVHTRVQLEADLRQALHNQEFMLHYQPQVDAKGKVVSTEALVRWLHPRHGVIGPNEFIPLAEETGLILPLGDWVLSQACQQLAQWQNQPALAQMTIAVNLSARQIHQPDFAERVQAILRQHGVNPAQLKLEITESMLVHNSDATLRKMKQLKALGIHFSLDDFGTGYASLSYLKHMPLDQLKIDRSFIIDLLSEGKDSAIAQMVVALARSLGLSTVAEGIETVEQKNCLDQIGCHAYQGFFFARPMPLDQFEAFVANQA